jgi:hypothetical protein
MPSRIVTHAYRPKRLPRKKAKAAAITGPAIVTAQKPGRRQVAAWGDDGQSDPELRAWLERAKWEHGDWGGTGHPPAPSQPLPWR